MSVFGFVPTRDEQSASRGPVERVYVPVSFALET